MSGTIGETGSVTTTSTTTTTGTETTDSDATVSSGYSTENSVSQTDGSSSDGSQTSVSLDSPEEAPDLLQQSFKARLEGFRSVFSNFKAQYSSGQIDLSDTQTLLLVFRGMISDIKALNNAETIDSVASQRQQIQSIRQELAEARLKISGNEAEIGDKNLKVTGHQNKLQESQTLLSTKLAELSDAQSADPVDVNLVNSLSTEVAELQSEINDLEGKISTLNGEIANLSSQNQALRLRVAILEALLVLIENSESVARAFAVSTVKSDEEEELETGEEKLDALKRELKELDGLFSREEMQVKLEKQILAGFNREVVRESDRYSESLQPKGLAAELKALLSPAALNNLFSLLSVQAKPAPSTISNQAAPSELTDAAEGLALILLAEPAVTASEENPVDQPYLGDSLSLEGANNPQAFALLLLKERMSDMQEALGKNAEGNIVDSIGANQLAQLLDAEREVDAMVMEADRDRELYEAAIPKSHPV
ncbi:hypothetical protein [Endozoicomonas atrinae]|uniref:hypothetical protein n=1 Tax=Endozoicomonas atrinae TaxID=1333660 RepID=UPI000825EC3A|nr:hypothetical protein [Endozoicomonas atrinae]